MSVEALARRASHARALYSQEASPPLDEAPTEKRGRLYETRIADSLDSIQLIDSAASSPRAAQYIDDAAG